MAASKFEEEVPSMAAAAAPDKEKRRRCELVSFDELPAYLKDNEFIRRHYRSEWPMKETILSLFSVHNETLNVWSHLLAFFLFLALTVTTAPHLLPATPRNTTPLPLVTANGTIGVVITPGNQETVSVPSVGAVTTPGDQETVSVPAPVPRWPFRAFLAGATVCLLASSVCHLLHCHSERAFYLTLRLDYVGIAALIATSFYPLAYYTFLCEPFYQQLYITAITAFGAATVAASLVPAFQTPEFRKFRALLFSCMAASGVVPVAHKLVSYGARPEAVATARHEAAMGAFYAAGVAVYAARVPERWMPGRTLNCPRMYRQTNRSANRP